MDRVSAAAAIKNMAESHARKLDSDLRPLFASVEASPSLFEKQRENTLPNTHRGSARRYHRLIIEI